MGVDKLSVVPEVFYDLISRVPAGMIVLVTACVVLQDCNLPTIIASIDSSPIPAIVVPVVGFVLSYVIGLALSALSGPLLYPRFDRWHKKTINERLEDLRGLPRGGDHIGAAKDNPESRRKAQMGLNIFLKRSDGRVGLEMSKHQAETTLFANLAVGFELLFVALLCPYVISKLPSASYACVGLCECLIAFLLGAALVWIAYWRCKSAWGHLFALLFGVCLCLCVISKLPSASCACVGLWECLTVFLLGAGSVRVAYLRYKSGWSHLFAYSESYLKRNSSRGSSSS